MKEQESFNFTEIELSAYIDGHLKETEKITAIEHAMQTNEALKAHLSLRLHLKRIHEQGELLDLIASVQTPTSSFGISKKQFSKVAVLIGGTILLGMGILYYNNYKYEIKQNQSRVLVHQFLNKKPDRDVHNSDLGQIQDTVLVAALRYYRSQQYKFAKDSFERLLNTHKTSEQNELKLYIVTCELKMGQYERTIRRLQELLMDSESLPAEDIQNQYFLNAVRWHLALAYLGEPTRPNLQQATFYLNAIPINTEYYLIARDMLKSMETNYL